ncbi:hypothetical protein [Sphingosinicella humi]|uniref:hypothetical protein n=1 Tax=Allosphingosinicella humi TaxID=2068657 RepID=UPI0011B20159|nr:hypothetical protein [Sphingosinicella humi]
MSLKLRHRNQPTFIASSSAKPYLAANMFRFLASLLVALGLMFAPVAMAHGQAMAAPHSSAPAMVKIKDGAGKHSPSSSHRSGMDISCAITCAAAVPAAEPMVSDRIAPPRAELTPAGFQKLIGIQPEGETPPPRITPEI